MSSVVGVWIARLSGAAAALDGAKYQDSQVTKC